MWRLIAHNHWFTIRILDREVRLCSRCTGYISGYLACKALSFLLILNVVYSLETVVKLAISLILLVPFALDWITQSWGLRNSNNWLRFTTGFILGTGVWFLSISEVQQNLKLAIPLYLGTIILACGLSAKLKVTRRRI